MFLSYELIIISRSPKVNKSDEKVIIHSKLLRDCMSLYIGTVNQTNFSKKVKAMHSFASLVFAARIVKLYQYLVKEKKESIISKQIREMLIFRRVLLFIPDSE